MTLTNFANNVIKTLKSNSPEILTALGVSGVVSTAYLASKASFKAASKLSSQDPTMSNKDKAKFVWKCYIPAGISGGLTIACILGSNKAGNSRTAAAVTAYSLTEKAFAEYKEKVVEQIGKNKEQTVHDNAAQARVTSTPLGGDILVVGKGNVLCLDIRSARYFRSGMEELRKAENEINFQLNHERLVSLSEFYILIGLPITKESVFNGWNLDRGLMELDVTATIAENDEPCLAIDYNYVQPL